MRVKLNLRLTTRLTLAFVMFAVGMLLVIGALSFAQGRSAMQSATIATLQSSAINKEAAFYAWIKDRQSDLSLLVAAPDVAEDLTALTEAASGSAAAQTAHDGLLAELRPAVGQDRQFLTLEIMDAQTAQVIVATDARDEGTFKEDQPYFINGKSGPYVQNPYYSLKFQQPEMAVSTPMRGTNGQLLGVLVGELNLDQMAPIIARRSGDEQSDDAYLVNTSSLFVTQPRFLSNPVVLQRGIHTQAVNLCLAGSSGDVLADDYRGQPAISVYHWLAERQLCLIVSVDQAEAFQPVRNFGMALIGMGILTLLTASVLALGLSRTLTRPLLALQTGVTRFGQGDLSVRLREYADDELGVLAHEFNTMAESLARQDSQLRDYASQLERKVEERTQALQVSEAELRALFSAMSDIILVLDAQGRYLKIAPTTPSLPVKPAPELVGRRLSDIFPAEQADYFLSNIQRALTVRQPINIEYSQPVDGKQIWFAGTISPMDANSVIWVGRDITERKRMELSVRRSEEQFRTLFETAPGGILMIDASGQCLLVNEHVVGLFGYSREELVGASVDILLPEIYRHAHKLHRADYFAQPGARLMGIGRDLSGRRKDGSEFPVEVGLNFTWTEQGLVALAIVTDITERIQMAQERTQLLMREKVAQTQAEERELLRALIDIMPDFVYVKDRQSRFVLGNTATAKSLGTSRPDDIIGKNDFDFHLHELATRFYAEEQALMRSGEALLNHEEMVLDPNTNSQRWLLTTKVPRRDKQGQIIGLVGINRDITDRKRREEIEREQRTLAEALHDVAKLITGTLDLPLVMSHVLENANRVLRHDMANIMLVEGGILRTAYWRGYPEELLPFISTFVSPVERLPNMKRMVTTGRPDLIPDTDIDPDWVTMPEIPLVGSLISAPIKIQGEVIGLLNLESQTHGFFLSADVNRLQAFADLAGIAIQNARLYQSLSLYATDLEERVEQRTAELRQALAKERELNTLKSGFITLTSHEFRTPLTTISSSVGLLELALDKMMPEQRQRHFDKIQTAIQQMVQLLESVLTFEQAESERLEFNPEPLNLADLCQSFVQDAQVSAGDAYKLSFSCTGDCQNIMVDAQLLQKIVGNLLANAVKFSPAGGPVHLDLACDAGRVKIRVEDHGIGIPQEDQKHMFEPFHRAGNVGTLQGVGLGLAITRKAVLLHGGTIEFESKTHNGEIVGGTTFLVTLPSSNEK